MTRKTDNDRLILVTGGAGFIGCNLVERLLEQPFARVRVFDNLSRPGVAHNVEWLSSLPGANRLEIVKGDVRDAAAITQAAADVGEIFHLAAQVAVTTSVDEPRVDFEVNALGTFNVLEAARCSERRPLVLFTSTNKVYGSLPSVSVEVDGLHYRAVARDFTGVKENEALDFHSPYGCSKGAADQYVRDYARIYDLPTVVFRMSCIAGPRQFGNEDQGWVAHFLYSVLRGQPITIYGDGYQVRDILHVSDLLDAMEAVAQRPTRVAGQVYNIGGGLARSVSIREMLIAIESVTGLRANLQYCPTRPGDQPLYVSDTTKLSSELSWNAKYGVPDILESILAFWETHRETLQESRTFTREAELIPEEVA